MKRRVTKLACILASCAALLGLSTASAGATASRPSVPDAFGTGILCDTTTQELCWSGHDGENGAITAKPYSANVAEKMSVTKNTKQCNAGQVSETCPFTEGSGLNAYYVGDDIVTLGNNDNHMTYYYAGGTGISEATSIADGGQFWVQVGSFENHSGMLVNVKASDEQYHTPNPSNIACWAMSRGTAGDPLLVHCGMRIKTVDTSNSLIDWRDPFVG